MSSDISPDNEQFIQLVVASGEFPTRGEALDKAVGLLRMRQELLAHIDEGTRQLRAGEYTEYGPDDQDKLLEDIRAASA